MLRAHKRIALVGVGCAAMLTALLQTPFRLGLDVQRVLGEPSCLPDVLYVLDYRLTRAPDRGDYVIARMPETGLGVGARAGMRIVKQVLAIAGDSVEIRGTEFYINGQHAGRLWLALSIPGKAPGDFDAAYTLGQNQFFLVGTENESFDSRYWGPVNGVQIVGYAHPLF